MTAESINESLDEKKFQQYMKELENKNSSQNSTGDINQVQNVKRQREEDEYSDQSKRKKIIYSVEETTIREETNENQKVCEVTRAKYKENVIDVCGNCKSPLFQIDQVKNILEIDNIIDIICDFSPDQILKTKVCQSDQDLYFLTEEGVNELVRKENSEKAKEFGSWIEDLLKKIKIANIVQLEQINIQLQQHISEQEKVFKLKETLYTNEIKKKERYIENIPKLGQINIDYAFINDKNYFRIGQENMNNRRDIVEDRHIYTQQCVNEQNLKNQVRHVLTNTECYDKDYEAYKCNVESIKTVAQILGSTYDVLYKCREGMSVKEIQEKIQEEQEKYIKEEEKNKKMLIKI